MFIIVDNTSPLEATGDQYEVDVTAILAVYDSDDKIRTAADAAEDYARTNDTAEVTVWTVPHARTFRFRQEMRLRLIEDD